MKSAQIRDITSDEIRTYQEDGVVHLKGLFDADWVKFLQDRTQHVMEHPSDMSHSLRGEDDPGEFFSETFLWHRDAGFEEFVETSPGPSIAGQVMQSKRINIVFDQILVKKPGTKEPTVWHQDLTYWPIRGDQVATLWLALDEVTEESGSMEFVRGSHKWGKRYKPIAFGGHSNYVTDEPPVPDIEAMRDELEFIRYDYEPGDCTLHHGLMVHAAGGNSRTDRSRRAYATRWAGDDVVYDPRPGIQRMLRDPEIEAGEPLDCDLWPRVWTRPAA